MSYVQFIPFVSFHITQMLCFFQSQCGGSQPTAVKGYVCPSVEINLSVGQHLNLSESNGYRFGMLRDAGNPLIGPLSLNIELSQW